MKLRFTPLSAAVERKVFACGVPELDKYLRYQAGQDVARGFATVIVALPEENPSTVIGYYVLSAASIPLNSLPDEMSRKMPRYRNIPAVLLGRLAVSQSVQGRHIGSLLLFDALKRACANTLAWAVFLVDAKNDSSAVFYEKFCFTRFQYNPCSLWMTRKQAERLIHGTIQS